MNSISFNWDEKKANENNTKHGVSFQEAKTAFLDTNGRLIHDPDHSKGEDRYILLGMSSKPRIIVVCHTYREGNNVIRIISARKATKTEQKQY